jgi:hypothetical protein
MGFGPKIRRPEKSGIKEELAFSVWAFLMQKIRGVFGGVVRAIPKLCKGARDWGDEPVPATLHGSTCFGFVFLKAKMRRCGGVVIDDSDFCLVEGVENGPVEFHKSTIFPKSGRARGVESESAGNLGKEVVAVFIGEVAGTDLRFHIPTTEGSGREGDAADFKAHIGNDWEGYPAEMERVEAGGIGMTNGDLQGFFFWGRKKMRLFSRKRNHDRKEIERSAVFGWGPAELEAEVGKICFGWIAQNLFFIHSVACISAELVVPDTRASALGIGGRKYGDCGSNGALVSCVSKVTKASVVDLLFGLGIPRI